MIVLGPAEVLPSQPSRRVRAQSAPESRKGRQLHVQRDFCAKATQGLAAHAQMRVKASVSWQVVRRHVAEVALADHVSLVVRLLQLGLSQRARCVTAADWKGVPAGRVWGGATRQERELQRGEVAAAVRLRARDVHQETPRPVGTVVTGRGATAGGRGRTGRSGASGCTRLGTEEEGHSELVEKQQCLEAINRTAAMAA